MATSIIFWVFVLMAGGINEATLADSPLVNSTYFAYHAGANLLSENRIIVGPQTHPAGANRLAEPEAQQAAALMRAVANKDRRAFEQVYYQYSPRLGRYLMRLLKRNDLVDEVLNDVMLVVWQSADRFDPALSQLSTWLFGIAHNKALKASSRAARHSTDVSIDERESDDFSENSDDPANRVDPANPEQTLMGRQLGRALQYAVDALSPEHRAVVELAFAEDYSYQDIATTLACPINTVKSRMFYARKHLAESLARFESKTN
jgi:RNA polymerase sigma-70 factor, ECF subfamily